MKGGSELVCLMDCNDHQPCGNQDNLLEKYLGRIEDALTGNSWVCSDVISLDEKNECQCRSIRDYHS